MDTGMISNENDVDNIVRIDTTNGLTEIKITIDRDDGTQVAVVAYENGEIKYIQTGTVQNNQITVNVGTSNQNIVAQTDSNGNVISTVITPGFYNANNQLIASWELVTGDKIAGGALVFKNGTKQTVTKSKNANGVEETIWGWNYTVNNLAATYETNTKNMYNILKLSKAQILKNNAVKLVIPEGITTLGGQLLAHCDDMQLATIVFPNSLNVVVGSVLLGYQYCYNITIRSDNPYYESVNGVVYSENMDILYYCPANKSKLNIPNTIKTINSGAFMYNKCTSIGPTGSGADIIIPNSVTTISSDCFNACSAIWVELPSSVIEINSCFALNSGTTRFSIYIPSSVTTIVQGITSKQEYQGVVSNTNATIYCETSRPTNGLYPSGWCQWWNTKTTTKTPSARSTTVWNVSRETYRANYRN